VNVSPESSGRVKINNINPSTYPFITSFSANTNLTFEAMPAFGYDFVEWSGALTGDTNPDSMIITCDNDLNWMSGILLKDDTTTSIYYPHTASGGGWATGIVAYNPADIACDITITPYSVAGEV